MPRARMMNSRESSRNPLKRNTRPLTGQMSSGPNSVYPSARADRHVGIKNPQWAPVQDGDAAGTKGDAGQPVEQGVGDCRRAGGAANDRNAWEHGPVR